MIVKRIHFKLMNTESYKINTPHVKTFADILSLYSLPVGVITQATDAPCQQKLSMYLVVFDANLKRSIARPHILTDSA